MSPRPERRGARRGRPAVRRQNPHGSPSVPAEAPPGLARRLAALGYDSLLLVGVLFAATALALPFHGGAAFAPGNPLFAGYLLLVSLGFYGWFWTHGGQTLGMRAWRIRLVAADGGPVNWRRASLRWLAALVSALCFGLGYLWVLADAGRRSWHDRVSGTRIARQS